MGNPFRSLTLLAPKQIVPSGSSPKREKPEEKETLMKMEGPRWQGERQKDPEDRNWTQEPDTRAPPETLARRGTSKRSEKYQQE
ncbi:hypothetical protein NDU88_003774 [Pleurodeles waltl]|uniref:Uncharacterized protein n=1 Tax=Pleurodeles waltl TaxID=8319 RepID=A0AAV7SGY0_PLEWA|nr:hypothetical protein NDU88_003774 [Pleurodeles waltl]